MFTLVPSRFFIPAAERETLAEVTEVQESDIVRHLEIQDFNAVLIYKTDGAGVGVYPEIYNILTKMKSCSDYNKIICSFKNGCLDIAVAQGSSLLVANCFKANDFVTAQYYIFLVVKSLQINPEMSTICWTSDLDAEDEMSLYRYFKAVVRL